MNVSAGRRAELLSNADLWDRAGSAEARRAGTAGDAVYATCRNAAQQLRLEAQTGVVHCYHLLPRDRCGRCASGRGEGKA